MAMATTSTQILYERPEIHKSCKSLETLLSVLSDYCEAAGAVVSLQKKLARALRENAGSKATNDVAANAFNASATIFEALADIDAKFAKIADKEYDVISTEVRKWFKKLAKEEKTHDEKLSAANGRIKQAGQVYEKKSKKNAREAGDEHARYINLISSLGPEISQEKYNHTLLVSQRHSSTAFSVAACVSRIADNEWSRSCEGVRRFAPTVGLLGEYRALCEGGWGGPMPADLPDIDEKPEQQPATVTLNGPPTIEEERAPPPTYRNVESREAIEMSTASRPTVLNLPTIQDKDQPSINSPRISMPSPNMKPPPSSFEPPRALVDPNTGSVRSLSAFPSPPTHIPPPLNTAQRHQQMSFGQSSQSSSTSGSAPTRHGDTNQSEENSPISNSNPPSPQLRLHDNTEFLKSVVSTPPPELPQDGRRPLPVRTQTLPPVAPPPTSMKGDYLAKGAEERESGALAKSKAVERSDSNGSIVAAMRTRYSYNSGASSPPPKDIPVRLPMSVTDLATRYQPHDGPSSPRIRAATRTLPSIDTFARQAEASLDLAQHQRSPEVYYNRGPEQLRSQRPDVSYQDSNGGEDETIRRQRRMEELEIKEKEQELRARELEIELKSRELERQRLSMPQPFPRESYAGIGAGGGRGGPSGELERQRDNLLSRERERYDSTPTMTPRASSQYGTSLNVPSSSDESAPSQMHESPKQLNALHPVYCTCETCKYSSKASRAGPGEKTKGGWMRRLSMPIVAGLDSKRSGNTIKGLSLDGKKNMSTTLLAVNTREDGRIVSSGRRSYDAGSGISNRSVTNLNFGR